MRNGENQKAIKENYNGLRSKNMSTKRQINELKKIIKEEGKEVNQSIPSIASEVVILIIIALIAAAALAVGIYTYEDNKDKPKDAFTSIEVSETGGTGSGTFEASGKTKLTLVADTGMTMSGDETGKSVSFLSIGGGGGTPGTPDTSVQFNDGGTFGGEPEFTYVKASNTLGVSRVVITDTLRASGFIYPPATATPSAGQVITLTTPPNTLGFTSASGVSTIDALNDASSNGNNFTDSIMLGQSIIPGSNSKFNTAVGIDAMTSINGGTSNVVIGYNAGSGITSGNNLTIIGASAGNNITSGSNLIVIGANANPTLGTASNEITLGDANHGTLRVGTQTLTSLSDGRDKTNIEETQYGLDFLMRLRPVDYTWQRRNLEPGDANNPKNGKRRSGFIAQELLEAAGEDGNQVLDLVYQANPERLEARYGNLIPSMVKSIQQLENKVRILEDKLSERDGGLSDM